jgi:nucleotide-binding universal stress UspA family protein
MTIVLGYDESPGSERALEVAIDLASTYAEPLVLVYGVAPPGVVGEEFRAHMDAVEELGRKATGHALERALGAGVVAEVELVAEKPAAALIDVADRRDARIIVVGSYGETPLRGVILGSTTYKVLNQSHRPVLVVKS